MTEAWLIGILIISLFLLLGVGLWVGSSLILCAVITLEIFTSRPVGDSMALNIWGSTSSWTLTALPLFIWMGEILLRSNLSETLFKSLTPWMHRLPGGLLHVNIVGSAVFAAISGSSAATAATVGKISIPELRSRQYSESMIIGTLAGAGTLGLLIPPSIALIVYGVTVNESISKLFIAGIMPGILLAGLFMAFVSIMSFIRKKTDETPKNYSLKEKIEKSLGMLPIVILIALVIGSIYSGVATPTEAAVLGVIGSLAIAGYQKSLSKDAFLASIKGTIMTSSMIAFILMGSHFLSLAMGFTGLPGNLAQMISEIDLSAFELIVWLTIFYIILGCFLDGLSSIVLTMAVIEPLVRQAGFDMIWFGVYLMVVVEMAQITPPVGFNLFVLQSMTGRDMGFIAKASTPMFFIMVLAVIILTAFPELATYLPSKMQ